MALVTCFKMGRKKIVLATLAFMVYTYLIISKYCTNIELTVEHYFTSK